MHRPQPANIKLLISIETRRGTADQNFYAELLDAALLLDGVANEPCPRNRHSILPLRESSVRLADILLACE